ncbi:MAG: lysylphosphatidylglycerol synthase transmembrane domain-containing protein, partial [Rhodothermales bacterium]
MSPQTRRYLAQAGSFVLAGTLLYLALRGVDLSQMVGALKRANYAWLVPLIAVTLLSHLLRAWRWQVLLKALPETESRNPSVATAFSSVMIGYMVNYAAPRLGEVARTANLARRERISFSGVFGTVFVERILDMIVLTGALASVFFLLLDRFAIVQELFIDPLYDQVGWIPALA